jgi:ADP-ribosylglycohydrolase/catechol 2,3-dioxygenase-like lactoylglutathione lyase family enzyme
MPRNGDRRLRAHGAMLGLAVGDALGWPMEDRGGRVGGTAKLQPAFEFMGWRRREGGGYAPHIEEIAAGEYSDDTQLALAVARSRSLGEEWWSYLVRVELPLWTAYERGGGGATKRAAHSWLNGRAPWEEKNDQNVSRYFAAGGNGALMRSLPHCLAPGSVNAAERNRALDLDGLATHGHPRALLGSRLHAAAVAWALDRREPLPYGGLIQRLLDTPAEWAEPADSSLLGSHVDSSAWEADWMATVDEVIHLLHLSLDGLAEGAVAVDRPILQELGAFSDMKGAGTISAVAAIFLASRYASQPRQGLLAAAFARGSDTDTLASLTAALLGALHGPDWLEPLAHEVQDATYLKRVIDDVLDGRAAVMPTGKWRRQERTELYRWLDSASAQDRANLGPFGSVTVAGLKDHETKASFVRSWQLKTELGQVLYVKRYDRGKDGQPRWNIPGRGNASRSKPKPPKPRAGLILQVAQLDRTRRFYEQVVGLEPSRATEEFVSFGWLALEPLTDKPPPAQLELAESESAHGQAIRVYLSEEAVERARDQASRLGLEISAGPSRFRAPAFRCRDPDGHIVEFVAHNGTPPVI